MKNSCSILLASFVLYTFNCVADVKIEEQIIGPVNLGGAYAVSPQGSRIAFAGTKGSRLVVAIDGVEGPVFDELYDPHGRSFASPLQANIGTASSGGGNAPSWTPVIFSNNGDHFAYAGRQGDEFVIIYDGKEIGRGPRQELGLDNGSLTLSPGGNFVYWVERQKRPGNDVWRLMMNGKPGPFSGYRSISAPIFSPDDAHYTYTFGSPDGNNVQTRIVDGKEAGYLGNNPVYTADSKLLLTLDNIDHKSTLLVNGKPVASGLGIRSFVPAPAGSGYAAIVLDRMEDRQGVDMLYLNGRPVRGTEGARHVSISPDGKRYALACENKAARSMYMIVDGKKGQEYQGVGINSIFWTPDSSRVIYLTVSGGRNFIIVDDQEMAITGLAGNMISMAQQGNRYAFATMDGGNRIHSVILDGESVLPPPYAPRDLLFSPDGSRFAYVVRPILSNNIVGQVVDGAVSEGLVPVGFSPWGAVDLPSNMFLFSDDGKHLAQFAGTGDRDTLGLYVDGKLVYPSQGRQVGYPSFTPDNKHLFWLASVPGDRPGHFFKVFVDGAPTVTFATSPFLGTRGAWEMDSNGSLIFFAVMGNDVKRYRVTASSDMNVARMVNEAEANRAKALADSKAADEQAAKDAQAAATKQQADKQAAYDAAVAKRQADYEAAVAKKKADYEAAVAARTKAVEEKRNARLLYLENSRRARQGLPPLKELPN